MLKEIYIKNLAVIKEAVIPLTDRLNIFTGETGAGKSILINGAFILIASFPCVLGYNVWSDLHIIGARDVLDSEDFIVSNILLPLGSLIFTLFCTSKYGWGFDKYLEETNTGSGKAMPAIYKNYFKFVLPILILIILIQGLVS